ncbi:MAG: hypothetical protein AAFW81_03135 [Pseudomonadota bacterium]
MTKSLRLQFASRFARMAVVVAFAVGQLATAAHALEDHKDHLSNAPCAICCAVLADDELDPPPVALAPDADRSLGDSNCIPDSQVRIVKTDLQADVRGPPRGQTKNGRSSF